MTQDEIIEMAIQGHAGTRDAIRWAINQVVKAEREACAKVCEDYASANTSWTKAAVKDCAAIIRARTGDKNPKPFPLPQRTFVGLTDEEIDYIYTGIKAVHHDVDSDVLCRAIEAKLKEKNFV